MQKFKTRIIIIFSLIIMAFFFTSDFSLIDIEKTAIIVAIGIDKKDDKYSVTAQIAIPQATDQSVANSDATVTGEGKTVFEAINDIGNKTGWHPKLSFCDLILLGDKVIEDDVLPLIDSFIKSPRIPNSALVAGCQGEAKEVLTAKTPLDSISAFAIQKILVKNPFKANNISNLDIKTFAVLSKSPSSFGFMPFVKKEEQKDENKDSGGSSGMASITPVGSSSGGAGGGGGGGGSSGGSQEKSTIFDATETVVFKDGKKVDTLDKEQTLIYNMLFKSVHETFIPIDDNGEEYLLSITENSNNIKVLFKDKPTVLVTLNLEVSEIDNLDSDHLKDDKEQTLVTQKHLDACSEKVSKIIKSIFEKSQKTDCDLLQAKTIIYKYHNDYYQSAKNLALSNFNIETNIVTKSLD